MKFIVQRVSSAACRVDDEVTGSIQKRFYGTDWHIRF